MRLPSAPVVSAPLLALALAACDRAPVTDAPVPAATTETPPITAVDQPPSKPASAEGSVSQNASSMPIVDHVAWWSSDTKTLHVVLSPALIAEPERQRLASGETAFMVLSSLPSPDDSRWQWFPFATMELGFDGDAPSTDTLRRVYLMAYGIEEANYTTNINLIGTSGEEHRVDVVGLEGDRLRLKTEGTQTIGDQQHAWAIDITP